MMKTITVVLGLLTFVSFANASGRDTSDPLVSLKCQIELAYPSADPRDQPLVVRAEAAPTGLSENPHVLVDLSPYTLAAYVELKGEAHEPTFVVELFQGNPVSNQINYSEFSGPSLSGESDKPATLSSREFLNFEYGGKNISRIDYSCSVTPLLTRSSRN